METTSRRPYLVRAIYDWALDNNLTPHLVVAAGEPGVVVPTEYVEEGRIVLSIAPMAVRGFDPAQDPFCFSARFGGRSRDLVVPVGAVLAVYAKESGEGLDLGPPDGHTSGPPDTPSNDDGGKTPPSGESDPPGRGKPKLRVVK